MSSCARASSGLPSHGFMTEEGEYLYTEGGDYIILEEAGSLDGYIVTQNDLYITTQSGDSIVTECFDEEDEGGDEDADENETMTAYSGSAGGLSTPNII